MTSNRRFEKIPAALSTLSCRYVKRDVTQRVIESLLQVLERHVTHVTDVTMLILLDFLM